MKEKTALQWFKTLPPEIRDRAINNAIYYALEADFDYDAYLKNKWGLLYSALASSFDWPESPEGFEFWSDIANT